MTIVNAFRRRLLTATVVALCVVAPALQAQQTTISTTRDIVGTLASEALEGREAGTPGERQAADYIAAQLTQLGARPLPGRGDMFVPFEFTAGSKDGGSTLRVEGGSQAAADFSGTNDVLAMSFSDDGTVSGEVVFAGYGLVVPENQNFGYDSYAGLDVTGKIVMVLRYSPENADQATRAILARYSDLRYKAMAARQRGARGLLVVTGPASPNAGLTIPMTFDTALAGSGISAASISGRVAEVILGGRSLKSLQDALDGGNPHVAGVATGRTVALTTTIVRQRYTARNVVAYLPATRSVAGVAKPNAAVPSRRASRPARPTSEPTTTRRARPRSWLPPPCSPNATARVTCCSACGRRRKSGSSARRPSSLAIWCGPTTSLRT
jgi:hypothetical protein